MTDKLITAFLRALVSFGTGVSVNVFPLVEVNKAVVLESTFLVVVVVILG